MTTPSPLTEEELAERAMDGVEGLADAWAAEVRLIDMIDNVVSPMRLDRSAPDDVREQFTARMKSQIDAISRQAFMEGIVRARLATIDQLRNAVVEECANKVRYDCSACNGDGYAEYNPLNDPCECEYCGRPMAAIRALKFPAPIRPLTEDDGE